MTFWKQEIDARMKLNGDSWINVEAFVPSSTFRWLYVEFNGGFGGIQGPPFTLWTKDFVYFPVCYDGSEWCGSAPRNPCDIVTEHQGG